MSPLKVNHYHPLFVRIDSIFRILCIVCLTWDLPQHVRGLLAALLLASRRHAAAPAEGDGQLDAGGGGGGGVGGGVGGRAAGLVLGAALRPALATAVLQYRPGA